jgi:hypothetical protein
VAAYNGEKEAQIPYADLHPLDAYIRIIRHAVVHEGVFSISDFFQIVSMELCL